LLVLDWQLLRILHRQLLRTTSEGRERLEYERFKEKHVNCLLVDGLEGGGANALELLALQLLLKTRRQEWRAQKQTRHKTSRYLANDLLLRDELLLRDVHDGLLRLLNQSNDRKVRKERIKNQARHLNELRVGDRQVASLHQQVDEHQSRSSRVNKRACMTGMFCWASVWRKAQLRFSKGWCFWSDQKPAEEWAERSAASPADQPARK
jgi:hypothetical protein